MRGLAALYASFLNTNETTEEDYFIASFIVQTRLLEVFSRLNRSLKYGTMGLSINIGRIQLKYSDIVYVIKSESTEYIFNEKQFCSTLQ